MGAKTDELRSLVPADMDLFDPEDAEQGELVDYEDDSPHASPAQQSHDKERCAAGILLQRLDGLWAPPNAETFNSPCYFGQAMTVKYNC